MGLATIIALIAMAYFRLKAVLSQTDQVLVVWEYIAETPILCNHISRIFTMFMKVRNPFSRSIGPYSSLPRLAEASLIVDFRITSLEVGRSSGRLKRSHKSDGPFRCTHGVALTLFAETLAGLAVFSRLGPKGKGILLKTETEYIKKAKGRDSPGLKEWED